MSLKRVNISDEGTIILWDAIGKPLCSSATELRETFQELNSLATVLTSMSEVTADAMQKKVLDKFVCELSYTTNVLTNISNNIGKAALDLYSGIMPEYLYEDYENYIKSKKNKT
ncbi:MAG: hypothetical protein RR313_00255 [Anaerovoracaceae bacterium]